MGAVKICSYSNYTPPNPNPRHFSIIGFNEVGPYTIVLVNYPGCTTFEGNKILVIEDSKENILLFEEIDPHFFENGKIVARFPATEKGMNNAIRFCRIGLEE